MTSTYHQVVAAANHAANLIGQGMLSTAAKELSRALSLNRKILIDLGAGATPLPNRTTVITPTTNNNRSRDVIIPLYHQERQNRVVPSTSFPQQVCLASNTSGWQNNEEQECEDPWCRGDFVYITAMYIPINTGQHSESPLQLHVDVSMVIMFNLALCHHLAGINKEAGTPLTRKKALENARSLYFILQNFLTKDQQELGARMLLLLASVNNLGQIFYILGDTTSGESCFSWMLSTLVLLTSSRWDQINNVDLAQFHKNTSKLVLNTPQTAHAA